MSTFSIILLFAGCGFISAIILCRAYFISLAARFQARRQAYRQLQIDRVQYYSAYDATMARAGKKVLAPFMFRMDTARTLAYLKDADNLRAAEAEKRQHDARMLCLAGETMDEFWLVYARAFDLSGDGSTTTAAAEQHMLSAFVLGNLARESYHDRNAEAVDSLSREGLVELIGFFKEMGVEPPANLCVR